MVIQWRLPFALVLIILSATLVFSKEKVSDECRTVEADAFRWCGSIIIGTGENSGKIEFLGCTKEEPSRLSEADGEGRYYLPWNKVKVELNCLSEVGRDVYIFFSEDTMPQGPFVYVLDNNVGVSYGLWGIVQMHVSLDVAKKIYWNTYDPLEIPHVHLPMVEGQYFRGRGFSFFEPRSQLLMHIGVPVRMHQYNTLLGVREMRELHGGRE